jgi:hypothetical protein
MLKTVTFTTYHLNNFNGSNKRMIKSKRVNTVQFNVVYQKHLYGYQFGISKLLLFFIISKDNEH